MIEIEPRTRRRVMPPPLPRRLSAHAGERLTPARPLPSVQSALAAIDAAVSHRIARRPNLPTTNLPVDDLSLPKSFETAPTMRDKLNDTGFPTIVRQREPSLPEARAAIAGRGWPVLLVLTALFCTAHLGRLYLTRVEQILALLLDLLRT
jgi:hypothetical protein